MNWTLWIAAGALAIAVGWLAWSPFVGIWERPSTDLASCPDDADASCADTANLAWDQSSRSAERATCAYPYGSTWPGNDE